MTNEWQKPLDNFLASSKFREQGALITDIDGTALDDFQGKLVICKQVIEGIQHIHSMGRPFILNTRRFPLSIIKVFDNEWYAINDAKIPAVLMNGSSLGYLTKDAAGLGYEEIEASPLTKAEISAVLKRVTPLLRDGLDEIVVFFYPRQWRSGEILWTPRPERIAGLKARYASASNVISTSVEELGAEMERQEACMALFLVTADGDKIKAYEHVGKNSYLTRSGVDKRSGAIRMAEILGISLKDSIGAGDAEIDNFLTVTGLSIHVGHSLSYKGVIDTVTVPVPGGMGRCLQAIPES